ncbi:iron-containing alcohol dehydrogenase [Salmonella enterica]|nr:iron-containing alcohol dehydrogenase [Salmonella enterica]EBP3563910.1 iron-containing alcohol dehydrogenase [Salmonella enterica subsp. enterica]EDT1318848.1 iron-containing alcohol dehydrogenase [Salmonella enterica subsp. enterica serovar Mississippi]EAX9069401.1 iron-containing alcohol dehydrogenase [Salmonella enterica]EBI7610880.1 iron-containing alcohol dehydrogenase [Salmonella enterica]
MVQIGIAELVEKELHKNIFCVIFFGVQPNPTTANVHSGLNVLHENKYDCIISLGGGSSHDCAKGVALLATGGFPNAP